MRRRTVTPGAGLEEVLDQLAAAPAREEAASAAAPAAAPAPGRPRERDTLQTEFAFELPRGYVDDEGQVHRSGTMRLATARDELRPQIDLRVKENPAYLSVVLLSQVITRLGRSPMCTRGSSSGCTRPTWRSSRTSTGGSTARATRTPR